ncbi:MAG TPA: arsenite methyltransferase [Candidatus Limnocylindrales bacterium]|nr:arsenite methyltransferase [Candidatus Limnocylindrales bacterium]
MTPETNEIHQIVRDHYATAAERVTTTGVTSCCGDGCCSGQASDPISADLYDAQQVAGLPGDAVLASLGCGNPTALAELHPGDVVLDLGSGGGIDVLLSAQRVGPTGTAYGLDMTDEMLALANRNKAQAGATNVEFLKGTIEDIPLPDATVDVIISNCVINLASDKGQALREAFRVLKPGGRFAVSDIVVRGDMPEGVRQSMEAWAGCLAGALEEAEFVRLLEEAGFVDATVEPTRVYTADDARSVLGEDVATPVAAELADGAFASAFIRAGKPVTA